MTTQKFTISTESIQATIQQYFAASRGNNKAEDMVACFAENCVSYDPADGPALNGTAEVHQFFQAIVDLFSTVGLTEEFVSINGQAAAVKWTGHGTGKNGREVTFEGIDLFEFSADGKIQSLKAYWNPTAMLVELGVP
ncbi:MAG: nuclear transport factor 2 family protein [Actinomycetota bacterium]